MLRRAGLAGISRDGGRVVIGAMTRVADLLDAPRAARPAPRAASPTARSATRPRIGGNLCAGEGNDAPRGDLQAPLIALGAQVRSAGAGGERTEPVEDFLAGSPADRLVLSIDVRRAGPRGLRAVRPAARPHVHHPRGLGDAPARAASTTLRIAVSGAGPHAVRLPAAEDARAGDGDHAAALADLQPRDDALASGWYRGRILPNLVARAVASLA